MQSAEVNMLPSLCIEAKDRPTVLYMLYCMASAQQKTFLCVTTEKFQYDVDAVSESFQIKM